MELQQQFTHIKQVITKAKERSFQAIDREAVSFIGQLANM